MYEFLDYCVEDVMTTTPLTVAPETPLSAVEEIFERHDFNGLPVVDSSNRLVGWLTKLDVLKAFRFTDDHMFPPYDEIMKQPVSSVWSQQVLTVTPRMHLTRLLEKLIETGSKSFPVVEDQQVIAVVAREDVLCGLRRAVAGNPPVSKRPENTSILP